MNPNIDTLRDEVKKYIDSADERVLTMVYALLKADTASDWWNTLPDNVKDDLEESIHQADNGQTLSHEEVSKKYPEWLL